MCGIYGWIGNSESKSLDTMATAMHHRGPDARGSFTHGNINLGSNRLSILDLDAPAQPYFNTQQTICAVYNGEIYNWKEIRQELEADGIQFQTQCDSEIIPHAWEKWGESMLEKFNGMFALALFEKGKNSLFLARDRCGQKPLYFAKSDDGAMVFASEPIGLFSVGIEKKLNRNHLAEYLALRYVSEPNTMFEDVYQVRSGHCGYLSEEGFKEKQWWQFPERQKQITSPQLLEQKALTAVNKSLQSDVPVGVFLSSGVDSSSLLAMANDTGTNITAITAGFEGAKDEAELAASLANQLKISHITTKCTKDDLLELPRVVKQMQVPIGDALILAFDKLAQTAKQQNCKVVLGGEGLDEIFHGYSFLNLLEKLDKLPSSIRKIAAHALKYTPTQLLDKLSNFPASLGKSGKNKLYQWLSDYDQLSPYWKGISLRSLFTQKEMDQLLKYKVAHEKDLSPTSPNLTEAHTTHLFEGWLQDWAIVRQDRNTMAHSIEYRIPFLDHELIEYSRSYALSQTKDKQAWREMVALACHQVNPTTEKIPFYFPIEAFSNNPELWSLIDDCLSEQTVHQRGLFNFTYVNQLITEARKGEFLPIKQVMSLVILEIWMREMLD